MRLLSFWTSHSADILAACERHIALVSLSTFVALALGVPAGVLAARRPRIGRPLLALTNVAQTIPSLALLGFLLPLPLVGGIGSRVAIVALILYALLPIVRGTLAGLASVDPAVVAAGTAMGMTPRQLLWMVQLPLALPSIVSGIRVATVIGVGTATVAAAVGAGGLGDYIFRGLSMVDSTTILAGAIPAACLALLADGLLTLIERALRPASRRGRTQVGVLAGVVVTAVLLLAVAATRLGSTADTIVVGSKNFTEQVILGEILAQSLERQGLRVTRRLNLGGTFICDQALRTGEIDLYPEYTGTALTAIFRQPVGRDREAVLAETRRHYADAGITVLRPLGFDNTFAILVRRSDAERHRLKTIGDLQRMAASWQAGFGFEFIDRQDGYRGLTAAYGLAFAKPPRAMDLSLLYRALAAGEVDVVAGDATSALISALDLAVLADDLRYFPPYDAVVVARTATLLATPQVRATVDALGSRISEETMRRLNKAVDVDKQDVATVARRFLDDAGAP